jgi:hypothetical protein
MSMLVRPSLIVVALLGACGDDGGASPDAFVPADVSALDATPREVVMDPHTLVPGEFIEGIMTGGPGDVVGIKLSAPAAEIEWNIHGHADGGTQIVHEEFDKMTVEYVFQPTAQADWYLLVRNGGSTDMTIDLQVELYGAVTWRYQ